MDRFVLRTCPGSWFGSAALDAIEERSPVDAVILAGLEPTGRLGLTRTNKHLRLITHQDNGYVCVEPTDPRVNEVRLLHDIDTMARST